MSDGDAPALRVALRAFAHRDDQSLAGWLPEAVAAIDGVKAGGAMLPADVEGLLCWVERRWSGAITQVVIVDDDIPVGLIAWRDAEPPARSDPSPVVIIAALATRADARNRGCGAEAVEWLERARPGARFYAPVPRTNGLAIYFWLHAGYRPVTEDDQPDLVRDPTYLWMTRAAVANAAGASPGC